MHRLINLLDHVQRVSIDRFKNTYYIDYVVFTDDGQKKTIEIKGENLPELVEEVLRAVDP